MHLKSDGSNLVEKIKNGSRKIPFIRKELQQLKDQQAAQESSLVREAKLRM